ncbi:Methylthioribose-1-phosphate isomerase [Desulfosarcina cetonica]|uniref:S-methyl-5-thioribose-1-phosphate isomerase n=1 Tax=Desulfosarcina cetonica TaxID=90730 RepID=UPI0006CFD512|nr:S-methyl-5-thioribose-1-phosphate isomerase [Desulfosarcina cetonica]VTR70732.1 Methylthioribose-1-phosphate isomerase [Desulfosarcina cetonica]
MNVDGKPIRPIWLDEDGVSVKVIDQRQLPHRFVVADLKTVDQVIHAIREMFVRGAPLIGVTGAYGVMIAAAQARDAADVLVSVQEECVRLRAARPTAVNLAWGVDRVLDRVMSAGPGESLIAIARDEASAIAEEEAENCRLIGVHGAALIEAISRQRGGGTVNILTHCNAGWLACIEYGTATAPIYEAFNRGVKVHVWVDETRPLNQGARLTAWELGKHGVPHTVITDNAGGHLMQHGRVDLVIVGTDRSTHTGDVANKIGTYLKALAARDNGIPFYVALPSSTFDWTMRDGVREIPIEERNPDEVRYIQGLYDGNLVRVLVPPENSPAADFAFDVTPARLVTGFITERGICGASQAEIHELFPEHE